MGVNIGHLEKRSMRINQHRTSVALEPPFWSALEREAARNHTTMPRLIATIDDHRPEGQSLASAVRCYVLGVALGAVR